MKREVIAVEVIEPVTSGCFPNIAVTLHEWPVKDPVVQNLISLNSRALHLKFMGGEPYDARSLCRKRIIGSPILLLVEPNAKRRGERLNPYGSHLDITDDELQPVCGTIAFTGARFENGQWVPAWLAPEDKEELLKCIGGYAILWNYPSNYCNHPAKSGAERRCLR